jgi:hypothetical protein
MDIVPIVTKRRNQRMQILQPTSDLRITGARLLVLFGLSMTLLVGCELPFGMGSDDGDSAHRLQLRDQVEIEPGLVASLYAPEQVATGDSFQVRFAIENTATVPIQLETGACWGQPAAFVEGEQVPLVGSFQACTMQLVSRTLPGNDTRERTFDLKALQNASNGSPEVEGPAEPGTYTLRTTLDWRVNGREVKKRLEADVEIVGQE